MIQISAEHRNLPGAADEAARMLDEVNRKPRDCQKKGGGEHGFVFGVLAEQLPHLAAKSQSQQSQEHNHKRYHHPERRVGIKSQSEEKASQSGGPVFGFRSGVLSARGGSASGGEKFN